MGRLLFGGRIVPISDAAFAEFCDTAGPDTCMADIPLTLQYASSFYPAFGDESTGRNPIRLHNSASDSTVAAGGLRTFETKKWWLSIINECCYFLDITSEYHGYA